MISDSIPSLGAACGVDLSPARPTPAPLPSCDLSAWFRAEVQPHERGLRAYLRNRFPTLEADDIIQDAYIRLCRLRVRDKVRQVRSLLFTIARNCALDAIRRRNHAPLVDITYATACEIPAAEPWTADAVSERQERRLLAEAVAQLPPRCRFVMQHRLSHRTPYSEIAARMSVARSTAENLFQSGVRHCTAYFGAHGLGRLAGEALPKHGALDCQKARLPATRLK